MPQDYEKIDDHTVAYTQSFGSGWGRPVLRTIFNFNSRQVVTLYERADTQEYIIPKPFSHGSSSKGKTVAMTSAMDVRNFRDVEGKEDIIAAYHALVDLGGKPKDIDDIIDTKSGISGYAFGK